MFCQNIFDLAIESRGGQSQAVEKLIKAMSPIEIADLRA